MNRDLFPHLPVIVAVARHRGFAPAAAALGMSASAVSHAVRTVENRLGEPLFLRTTRSVSLSEAGTRFLAEISPALDDIAKAFEGVSESRGDVTGTLKINASRLSYMMVMPKILARLSVDHPRLSVELHANEAFVDIVEEGFDAGIRLGESLGNDMVATRIFPPIPTVLAASPAYLAKRGEPLAIADLHGHECIGFRFVGSGAMYDWELVEEGRRVEIEIRSRLIVNDMLVARDLACEGLGIGYFFEPIIREELAAGRLISVLPQNGIVRDGLFLYYPRRASQAAKLRVFIEAAKAVLR